VFKWRDRLTGDETMRISDKATLILLGTSIVFMVLAALMTPETFVDLGPLRRSLTSDNDMVRTTALFEVALFRAGCGIAAVFFLGIAVFRDRLMSSRLWRAVTQHQPQLSGVPDFGVFNLSLKVMLLLVGAGLLFIAFAPGLLEPVAIDFIIEEDGVVEYASALFFLISSVLALSLLMRFKMPTRHRVMLSFLAFCLFVFFGEEISWGQRIFGIETLNILADANVQNENNLHNLFGYLFPSLFLLAVIVYGFVFPFVAKSFRFMHQVFDLMGLPIASRGLAIGFISSVLFRDWTFEKLVSTSTSIPAAEIGEMFISAGFLLLIIEFRQSLLHYCK